MADVLTMLGVALAGALVVALPGALVLRLLRHRSIVVHVAVLVAVVVLAVLAGVIGVARAMFISDHDLRVLLIVISLAGAVSLGTGWWLGRRLAADAMWADEARARERRAEANRRDLVAWVSHDLRTPLAGLRAMAEALEDGIVVDTETVADYHRRIRVEADRMAGLVDDLFELSRLSAAPLPTRRSAVSLRELAEDVAGENNEHARSEGVRLALSTPDGDDRLAVQGDPDELTRAVTNLVGNAIRHTAPGGTVTVSVDRETDGRVRLAVTDACGGIPADDLERVFDIGWRGDEQRTPEPAGNSTHASGGGLGLAIARGVVESHDGRIGVTNVEGGCAFQIDLPPVAAHN